MKGFSIAGLGLLILPALVQATAITTVYYAGYGTMPSSQGFTALVDPPIAPTISNGILHVDAYTQGNNNNEAYYTDVNGTFLFSSFMMEAGVQIVHSTLHDTPGGGNFPRAGFILEATDNTDKYVQLELTENQVWLQSPNSNNASTSTVLSFDTTNAYHDYRVVGSGGVLSLYIDFSPTAALTFNVSSLFSTGSTPSQFLIGDASFLTRSDYNLQYALFSSDTTAQFNSAPEPAAFALSTSGIGALWLVRRRKRT